MKVALLTNAPAQSGVGYHAWHLVQALRTVDPTLEIDEYFLNGQQGELILNGTVVATLPHWPRVVSAKTIQWLRLGRLWQSITKDAEYDVYHATNQSLSFLITPDQPWVVTVHDIIERQQPQSFTAGLTAQYLYRGLRQAQHIIALSKFSATSLQEYYPVAENKITIIPNGVAQPFIYQPNFAGSAQQEHLLTSLGIPSARVPRLLFVGSHHSRKNFQFALQVLRLVQKRYPKTILIKVGRKAPQPVDSVFTVDTLSESQLAQLYTSADALLFPSTFEGFGLPVLQAMACGLPVIANPVTSIPEVAGEAALLCPVENSQSWVNAIWRIIEEPELKTTLREKGLAQAQKFAWPTIALQTRSIYEQVIV